MSIRSILGATALVVLTACNPADQQGGGAAPGTQEQAPDNTARNAQDRDERAKTPFDQSERSSDVAITAAIRRQILATENLSTNADNVKIMTDNGTVTLRGVVDSESERDTIVSIAERIAGVDKVDDQLEVGGDAGGDPAEPDREREGIPRDQDLDAGDEGNR